MSAEQPSSSKELSFDKLKQLDTYFDRQLEGVNERPTRTRPFSFKKLALGVAIALPCVALPFMVLIRGSLYMYANYGFNGWAALLFGTLFTSILLLIYAILVNYFFTKTYRVHKYIRRGIFALVLAYCAYGLLYLSSINAKDPQVKSYYHSLHPILRVTLATTILAAGELVITDLQRNPEDYEAMGLSVQERSMHYRQASGYVHAADIRTLGRSEWKNLLIEKTFRLLGLNTLRHTGTADHLHVSLPLKN